MSRCEDGFTLVETLVALAVVGLMTSGAAGLVGLLNTVNARAEHVRSAIETVAGAQRVFRSLVTQAVADPRAVAAAEAGASDRMTVLGRGPASLQFDRPQPIELLVTRDGETETLDLIWIDPSSGARRAERVIAGAASIAFRYFLADDGLWSDEWRDGSSLPRAMMLRIVLREGGPPFEIVARTSDLADCAPGEASDCNLRSRRGRP